MIFYKTIAPYYHHIFKINVNQINFTKSNFNQPNAKIIDIGCGIGTLSFELNNYYTQVLGIDMDAEMIRVAKEKGKKTSKSIEFKQLSMLELDTTIDERSIDGIVCFGNTLVHLNTFEEIASFLKQSKAVLKPNGKLLLQIVNYDRILSKNIKQLPKIDNDEILFERNYYYQKTAHKIDFNTRLTVKSSKEIIENSIKLLPVLKNDLALLLNNAGFKNCNYYGNFNKDPYTIDSPALVISAW
jgi:2-polyprenyl-3-methyl-5-hydroxy-6-metoxy-1,4-benzoquinol methylase